MHPISYIIVIHEFRHSASLEQNFRAAMCHVLHYSCNVNAAVAVADSLRCRMICGTVSKFLQITGQIVAVDREVPLLNTFVRDEHLN